MNKILLVCLALIAGMAGTAMSQQYDNAGVEDINFGSSWTRTLSDGTTLTMHGLTPLNLISFGAFPDDSIDDTAFIQAAIDSAFSYGGGTVYPPDGRYNVSAPIELKSGVSIVGIGRGAEFFMAAGSDTSMFWGDDLDNVTISGLHLNGNSDNQTYTSDGTWYLSNGCAVIMRTATYSSLVNCRIENFQYGTSISGENTHHIRISDNDFNNVSNVIDTYGIGYVISGNNIQNAPDGDYLASAAIQLEVAVAYQNVDDTAAADTTWTDYEYLSLDNTITGNTIRNIEGPGIVLHGGNAGFAITGNTMANVRGGINCYHTDVKNGVISGNVIRNVTGGTTITPWTNEEGLGIGLNSALGVSVTDNVVANARVGILTYKSKRVLINDNYIERPALTGITAYLDTLGVIDNNYVFNAQWPDSVWSNNSGILLHSCFGTSVSDNDVVELEDAAGTGYAFKGVNVYLSGNEKLHLANNRSYGVLNDSDITDLQITPSAAPPDSTVGRFWLDNSDTTLYYYNGTAWITLE